MEIKAPTPETSLEAAQGGRAAVGRGMNSRRKAAGTDVCSLCPARVSVCVCTGVFTPECLCTLTAPRNTAVSCRELCPHMCVCAGVTEGLHTQVSLCMCVSTFVRGCAHIALPPGQFLLERDLPKCLQIYLLLEALSLPHFPQRVRISLHSPADGALTTTEGSLRSAVCEEVLPSSDAHPQS